MRTPDHQRRNGRDRDQFADPCRVRQWVIGFGGRSSAEPKAIGPKCLLVDLSEDRDQTAPAVQQLTGAISLSTMDQALYAASMRALEIAAQ
jgi:hypothetical protein